MAWSTFAIAWLVAVPLVATPLAHGGPQASAREPAFPGATGRIFAGVQLRSESLPAEVIERRAALVPHLCDLARWCQQVELFAERDRTWRMVLAIDPDHVEARRVLRHVRRPDGTWSTPPGRDVRNRTERARPEFERRLAELLRPFSECAVAHALSADPGTRAQLVDAVYALDPNDPTLHVWLGEVEDGARWVLPETVRARGRRAEWRGMARATLAGTRPVRAEARSTDDEPARAGGTSGFLAGVVRVFTEGDAEEARGIVTACSVAFDLGARLFQSAASVSPLTFYRAHATEAGRPAPPDARPLDDEAARPASPEAPTLPHAAEARALGADCVLTDASGARALETAVRQAWTHVLTTSTGSDELPGWIHEGVVLYLTRDVTGARLAWVVSPRGDTVRLGDDSLGGRWGAPGTSGLRAALLVLTSPYAPDLMELLRRDRAEMDARDVLVAYALAAYLLEGRPDSALEFLRRSTAGERPADVTSHVLGLAPAELRARLVRWLAERR